MRSLDLLIIFRAASPPKVLLTKL
ncbi:hypothetical protein CP061683_0737A, partial [Chlamydia psittaci 06-1683]